jgi:hypothetical protein
VLPTTDSGYGEVRTTPKPLRNRQFTLPDTVPALPGKGFTARVTSPAPRDVIARSSWRPRCPVAPEELAWLRMAFWGFDDRRHTGELLVNEDVAQDLVEVFERLYAARFPMEELTVVTRKELNAPPTGDANPTTAFACRPTTAGRSSHSTPTAWPSTSTASRTPTCPATWCCRSWPAPTSTGPSNVRA